VSLPDPSPGERLEPAFSGDAGVNNELGVLGANQLGINGAYSGTAYTFAGPADPGAAPVQLGFEYGDLIRLSGGGVNDGAELTINDPSTLTVLETLTTPDATYYSFDVRRIKR
jgi:hypothetical protein